MLLHLIKQSKYTTNYLQTIQKEMASEKLQKILAMSKNMDKKSQKHSSAPTTSIKKPISIVEQIQKANTQVAAIDAEYNSPYIPTQKEKEAWNTERGREELVKMSDKTQFEKMLGASKLPKAILESIRNNPCNYDPSMVNEQMGPENEFFKKLNEAYGKKDEPKSGVSAVQQINELLALKNKQKLEEKTTIVDTSIKSNSNFDLSTIEEMIERVIDKKLNSINESISKQNTSSIKSMSLTENGSFRFLDSEGNVYECQMKYLGKRKKK